jgi:hypothetical protein
MPQVSQPMSRVSQAMARVSQAMSRVSQRIGFSDVEQDFFRAGDAISASETPTRDEHDHDAWRQPPRRFSLKRSMLKIVTLPVAVVRHFTAPREQIDWDLGVDAVVRAVTGHMQRMSSPIQRMTGQIHRMTTGRVSLDKP